MAFPAILSYFETDGDMKQGVLLRKDILIRLTATLFLISGLAVAMHFGTFL